VWFFYVVRCSDSSLYAGISTDVERRVKEHNCGNRGAKYTRGRRPVALARAEYPYSKGAALRRERWFKSLSKNKKELFLTENQGGI